MPLAHSTALRSHHEKPVQQGDQTTVEAWKSQQEDRQQDPHHKEGTGGCMCQRLQSIPTWMLPSSLLALWFLQPVH